MQGWVSFHRKIEEWEWYDDANTFRLFFHLVLKANHKDNKWRGIDIKRGELVTSNEQLAKQLKLTVSKIRTSLNKLKSTGEITIKTTNKNTVVTIANYDVYQSDEGRIADKTTNESQTNRKQIATNNNVNNENNENKENSGKQVLPPCPHQEVISIWSEVMNDQRQPRVWDGQRKANLANRWKECFKIMKSDNSGPLYTDKDTGLEFWRNFFIYMRSSDFLINDCKPFGLDWIVNKANFTKIFEGNYHG